MKYAIRGLITGRFYGSDGEPDGYQPIQFDSTTQAINATRNGAAARSNLLEIVGVEETPGETRREVVELEGVVDLTGMKFAVVDRGGDYWSHNNEHLCAAPENVEKHRDLLIFDTLADAHRAYLSWGQPNSFGSRVVGTRETTDPPTLRVVELG